MKGGWLLYWNGRLVFRIPIAALSSVDESTALFAARPEWHNSRGVEKPGIPSIRAPKIALRRRLRIKIDGEIHLVAGS
jgi:hypothetical protein